MSLKDTDTGIISVKRDHLELVYSKICSVGDCLCGRSSARACVDAIKTHPLHSSPECAPSPAQLLLLSGLSPMRSFIPRPALLSRATHANRPFSPLANEQEAVQPNHQQRAAAALFPFFFASSYLNGANQRAARAAQSPGSCSAVVRANSRLRSPLPGPFAHLWQRTTNARYQ